MKNLKQEIIQWIYVVLLVGGAYFIARSFSDWRVRVNVFHLVKKECLK